MSVEFVAEALAAIATGRGTLGIELGSTRIKACLIGPDSAVLAVGSHDWENQIVDGFWTYSLDAVWTGVQACYASLVADAENRYGVRPSSFAALGVSAMMHGYLAFDMNGELLVPFRTWRNTCTGAAAAELTEVLGQNIPLRWSVAHLYQAVLDAEPHLRQVSFLTTLAGYVHWKLTGRKVLGVGDASGMFPIDPAGRCYDQQLLARFDALVEKQWRELHLVDLLPEVLVAGEPAGTLTADGAALLDPTGLLRPGVPLCPPEGDAGTGMVATNSVAARMASVSVGTSIFAMVVLERPLERMHEQIDVVTSPAGDLVAMVHCNNGANELGAWAGLFGQFAASLGHPASAAVVFEVLLRAALIGDEDAGGLLTYNYLAGEPVTGLERGCPLFVRTADSRLTLENFARAQVYGVFAALALGMRVLGEERVALDAIHAHGGIFRTEGVAQRLLSAALAAPVTVGGAAGEGGAWGMAILAAYLEHSRERDLSTYLADVVFAGNELASVTAADADVKGFAAYLERYQAGLAIEQAATRAL